MDINWTKEEKGDLSNVFINKTFKKFIGKIIEEKKDAIVEQADDLEMLHKLRYSLDGNREVLDELEKIHIEYSDEVKPKEKVDPQSII